MVEQTIYEVLDTLAERHIPEGKHKLLHVNSREAWVDLMTELLETGAMKKKLSILTKCAASWELLLVQKLSIQN
jgi:hypothetical protein